MRIQVRVTDSAGSSYEGALELLPTKGAGSKAPSKAPAVRAARAPVRVDLSLPVRAFMNQYARGRSGPVAFALLVARLAAGGQGEVSMESVKAEWNRMKGIIGTGFANVHASRAKNKAWIDSPRRGVFVPLNWEGAVNGESA